jgi:two-component system repressor protein LuxO
VPTEPGFAAQPSEDLPAADPRRVPAVEDTPPAEPEVVPLAVMERRLIEAALRRTNHDVPRAAALLEVNPSTIYRKLRAWRTEAAAGQS